MFNAQFQNLQQLIQDLISENKQLKQELAAANEKVETLELKELESEEQQQEVQAKLQHLMQMFTQPTN